MYHNEIKAVLSLYVLFFSAETVTSCKYCSHGAIIFSVFVAKSVILVHEFGHIFEKVTAPAVSDSAATLLDTALMFIRYYKTNEHFDLLTHGMGPGLVSVVMHNFSQFMGELMGQKNGSHDDILWETPVSEDIS